MSEPINDGGPAFPQHIGHVRIGDQGGMTLRDYFAAAALTGMMAYGPPTCRDSDAREAYRLADAMLKAKEAKP